MATKILQKQTLPTFLPHGWKKEVAAILGVHHNTITRHIKSGKGAFYAKIVKTATKKYGK